ncbi:MAG: autotransporter assembly complex family protein [Gammaproteobacteria bacterium]|nr:autotransporter assembly complex family protein [Gammaproteobacteria bacterium]
MIKISTTFKTRQPLHAFLLAAVLMACAPSGLAQPVDATVPAASAPTITISGADRQLDENLRAHLRVLSEPCSAEQRRLDRLLPEVTRDVERAAQALGYYQLRQQAGFTAGTPCWALAIDVTPGEPVRFGPPQINITAGQYSGSILLPNGEIEEIDPFARLLAESPVREGAQLLHSNYEDLKSSLSAVAVEHGYFAARFNRSELSVDLQRNVADVTIDFDPGDRYQFGTINITPIEELSSRLIARFLPFVEGSPYSSEMLIKLRESLNDSQYFSQVAVTPQLSMNQAGGTYGGDRQQAGSHRGGRVVPVTIELTPRARRSWSAGLGVTTDIGPRLTLAYQDHYFNRSGHRLKADAALSPARQEPNLSYVIPMRNPATESLSISTGYLGQQTDAFNSDTYRVGVSYRSIVDAWLLGNEWLRNIYTNFQRENSVINDLREQSNLTISGINWARTQSDDPIFPTRGWRLFGQISGASNAFVSDMSFLQLHASGKFIHSFGPGRLLLRAEAATTIVDALEELPVTIRFFTGGDQTVRGYQFNSLGALNELGEVIGGKHLLTGSAEYDFEVRPGWKMAVFYDVGNSFADFAAIQLHKGVGVGVRWMSPIGPIRADLGMGVGSSTEKDSFRLHITMGPDL